MNRANWEPWQTFVFVEKQIQVTNIIALSVGKVNRALWEPWQTFVFVGKQAQVKNSLAWQTLVFVGKQAQVTNRSLNKPWESEQSTLGALANLCFCWKTGPGQKEPGVKTNLIQWHGDKRRAATFLRP